jgi:hypothetical protein
MGGCQSSNNESESEYKVGNIVGFLYPDSKRRGFAEVKQKDYKSEEQAWFYKLSEPAERDRWYKENEVWTTNATSLSEFQIAEKVGFTDRRTKGELYTGTAEVREMLPRKQLWEGRKWGWKQLWEGGNWGWEYKLGEPAENRWYKETELVCF